ncbi:hypothetical protein ALC62_09720 [Cyphomyrmex costatus]|uniref:Uncharacterized protein n=1 Tax=Cyphomyrmex costatus TaxID=456900 RepID=A0A151IF35_9HYME|nr:hypothetical protein ALC62_09720 [Cyphomyrmex costatus]
MSIKRADETGVPQTRGLRGILSSTRCEHERGEGLSDGARRRRSKRRVGVECGVGVGVVAEWVPPEVGLVGRGVGGGGVGCLGQNQYCGHPSLDTPLPHP